MFMAKDFIRNIFSFTNSFEITFLQFLYDSKNN